MKSSVKEITLREKVKNWFIRKINYDNSIHKSYALVFVQCNEGLKEKLGVMKDWEADINNQSIGILKSIK